MPWLHNKPSNKRRHKSVTSNIDGVNKLVLDNLKNIQTKTISLCILKRYASPNSNLSVSQNMIIYFQNYTKAKP